MILYEHPFNERIRTYLRLEHLFQLLDELIEGDAAVNHHFALQTMFDVMEVANRPDLKAHILKDLERQKAFVDTFRGNPEVSATSLNVMMQRLDQAFARLNTQHGKPGQDLATNEWLMGIRSRLAIPGGTCAFDLPSYHAWQHQDAATRRDDILRWRKSLQPLEDAVLLLLHMLRSTEKAQMMLVSAGQLQLKLPREQPVQLLRMQLDESSPLVPEVSGNQLMASIRLMQPAQDGSLQTARVDTSIRLALCS